MDPQCVALREFLSFRSAAAREQSQVECIAPESEDMARATLLVIQGIDQGARFEVGDDRLSIGRGHQNEIRIPDTEISRQHAYVGKENGKYTVSDRNSSNGTFVNGVPVRTAPLENGDRVQIGRSVLLFQLERDEPSHQMADRVDIIGQQGNDDRSSIVGEVSHEIGATLLGPQSELAAAAQDPDQMLANLRTLYRIADEVTSPSNSIDQLLERILRLTIEVVGADRGCMLVSDPQTGEFVPRVFSHDRDADVSEKMPVSRSIVDYVLKTRTGVRTSDARSDRRFEPGQSILQEGIREAMCVPMHGRYDLAGVIYVDTTIHPADVVLSGGSVTKFSEEQLRLLVAIGRQAALTIENNHYQQALLKAERLAAMGQTIAMLSHHIKNILQGVRGGSYLIEMGLRDHTEDMVRKGWGIVERNQGKIYHLVMDMLTFSKDRQPVLEPANLNETVNEVFEMMQPQAGERGVELKCDLSPDVPMTSFDSEGIHRAVLNLVINAIDAVEGGESGTVLIKTGHDRQADTVFVAVIDNGPGIPQDQMSRIFNVFESTKGGRGTGLGLPVSQKIVREHGGEIQVDSKPGEGSRFVLSWPRIEGAHRPVESQTRV